MGSKIANYRGFNFKEMWKSRWKVTAVESFFLQKLLEGEHNTRILDSGFGFGRMFKCIKDHAEDYYAVDINPDSFQDFPAEITDRHFFRVVGNLYRLPFRDNSFDGAVMIRVVHHLEKPREVLSQLHRVINPGGFLILTFNPRPSISTFLMDIKQKLAGVEGPKHGFITFERCDFIQVAEEPFPIFSSTFEKFRKDAELEGFVIEKTYDIGMEDFPVASMLPLGVLLKYPMAFTGIPLIPTLMIKLRIMKDEVTGNATHTEPFSCPACDGEMKIPVELRSLDSVSEIKCESCGYIGRVRNGIFELPFFN